MNNASRVEVDTTALTLALGLFTKNLDRETKDVALKQATNLADETRGKVPRRSGRLAASIRAVPTSDGAQTVYGQGVPYAGWIEYGGGHGRPYVSGGRYLGPSSSDSESQFARAAEQAAQQLARRI